MVNEACSLNFYAGEEKFVEARIVPSRKNETAVIICAAYELTAGGETCERGNCEVNVDKIRILLKTDKAGIYSLKITAKVGQETVIQKVSVAVRR